VYAAHGSGIGLGLIAAKILAGVITEAASSGRDLGQMRVVKKYQNQFHRIFSRRLKFAEGFRIFSQGLDQERMSSLIRSGLVDETLTKQTLNQQEARLPWQSLPSFVINAARYPGLFSSLAPALQKALFWKL
ncbi:MAG TPA: hypothetical protein VEL47_00360, partial [Myxococcota bacterium]|nr:hypothetical protein [Myxococcota bacterium]